MNHPTQPLKKDKKGVLRFKENKIISYLLNNGGIDLNQLSVIDFTDEDRRQFAQLIGYSLDGYSTLSYVDDLSYSVAYNLANTEKSEVEAKIEYMEKLINSLKNKLRVPMAKLFEVHPDDLK